MAPIQHELQWWQISFDELFHCLKIKITQGQGYPFTIENMYSVHCTRIHIHLDLENLYSAPTIWPLRGTPSPPNENGFKCFGKSMPTSLVKRIHRVYSRWRKSNHRKGILHLKANGIHSPSAVLQGFLRPDMIEATKLCKLVGPNPPTDFTRHIWNS